MPENYDLEDVITDSLTDSQTPTEPVEAELPEAGDTPTEPEEVAPEGTSEAPEANLETAPPTEDESPTKSKSKALEDFDKKFGIEPNYPSGRENRIPYSRVKKIAQKAVKDARKEWETEFTPKSQEYETKIKTYEERLSRVDQFEDVMVNKPEQFLEMLSRIPTYKQFFSAIESIFDAAQSQSQSQPQTEVGDDMPQPDVSLPDGSLVYSEKGLRGLQAWNREQARAETMAEVDKRYGPIEQEWQAQKRIESLKPVVNAQIAEARTWEQFNENEEAIVNVLKSNPKISLEGAYRQVVFPRFKADREKLVADRNKMRQEVLQELQHAPKATSVPIVSSKSSPSSGPRSLEDIIAGEISKIR